MKDRRFSVTVNAFDRTMTRTFVAQDEDEARHKALESVHFLVKVRESPVDEHGIPLDGSHIKTVVYDGGGRREGA